MKFILGMGNKSPKLQIFNTIFSNIKYLSEFITLTFTDENYIVKD